MADSTTDTAAGTHPDAVKINQDGTVDTGGRRAWVWCKDPTTGHRFDVLASRLPRRGAEPVPGYPLNFRRVARDGKPFRDLAAETADPVKVTAGSPPFAADGSGGGWDIPGFAEQIAAAVAPTEDAPVPKENLPEHTSGDAVAAEQATGEPAPAPDAVAPSAEAPAPGDITATNGLGGVSLAEAAEAQQDEAAPLEVAEGAEQAEDTTKTTTRSKRGGSR